MPRPSKIKVCGLVALAAVLLAAAPAQAYIGPGAGFALGGSLLFALAGVLLAVLGVLTWPFRLLVRAVRHRKVRARRRCRRVVVLGLDGLDPGLAREFMAAGDLPNLRRLADTGAFRDLGTTLPAVSPVAWSTFATGVDPGGHGIFDFLRRDLATYLPELSSTRLVPGRERRLGPLKLGRTADRMQLRRHSRSFWAILGEHGVESTILRVPLTFPPEKFPGRLLSAMCLPDLRGTQGTFTVLAAPGYETGGLTGGERRALSRDGDGAWSGGLPGPDGPDGDPVELPVRCRVDGDARRATITVGREAVTLGDRESSDWMRLPFRVGRATAHGIARLRVVSWEPFALYVTPINIDPRKPAMPISQPPHYAMMLGRVQGPFATLGLAEDTWALNERVLDEDAFLEQVWDIHAERERQWFHALDRQRTGVVVSVFDATDRLQHTFLRFHDGAGHPANHGADAARHRGVIRDLYRRADDLVGRTLARLHRDDVLLVMSDHGFKPFRRAVNLNAWFREHGYLRLRDDPDDGPLPSLNGDAVPATGIDWSRTRAYANGLAGFYLNVAGRERQGVVAPADAAALRDELMTRLRGLADPSGGEAIRELWASADVYRGPYRHEAPDVIVGYNPGWRADWDMATGGVIGAVFRDNDKPWSADHCMDPRQVPGVLFSNRPLPADEPSLVDLAPTILDLCGVPAPRHLHGRSLLDRGR